MEVRILPGEQKPSTTTAFSVLGSANLTRDDRRTNVLFVETCTSCGHEFGKYPVVDGRRLDLHGRKMCLACRPLRRLRGPRKPVVRARQEKTCAACGRTFPGKIVIDGKLRWLYRRRFCLSCSPFRAHNTSKSPPGEGDAEQRLEARRRKRNAKTYRSLKKRRRRRKSELIAARGGRCLDCGYSGSLAVFEFHHRDPTTKSFTLAEFGGGARASPTRG